VLNERKIRLAGIVKYPCQLFFKKNRELPVFCKFPLYIFVNYAILILKREQTFDYCVLSGLGIYYVYTRAYVLRIKEVLSCRHK